MKKGLSCKHFPGFFLEMDDPEDVGRVSAYCRLSEYHVSIRNKAVHASFECWRSFEAWDQGRNAFWLISVQLKPNEGGSAFFDYCQSIDNAESVEHCLTVFCVQHSQDLQDAELESNDGYEKANH